MRMLYVVCMRCRKSRECELFTHVDPRLNVQKLETFYLLDRAFYVI